MLCTSLCLSWGWPCYTIWGFTFLSSTKVDISLVFALWFCWFLAAAERLACLLWQSSSSWRRLFKKRRRRAALPTWQLLVKAQLSNFHAEQQQQQQSKRFSLNRWSVSLISCVKYAKSLITILRVGNFFLHLLSNLTQKVNHDPKSRKLKISDPRAWLLVFDSR